MIDPTQHTMEDTHLNQLRDNLEVLSSVTTTMQSIINNSQLAGYFEEGIQKLVSGIELLVEKVEAMKNFNLLKVCFFQTSNDQ